MTDVSTSYTFAPVCDTRTAVGMGVALLVTAIVAVALGVLAHLEYINPVIAYSVGPASGALLMLIGAAISSIRERPHLLDNVIIRLDPEEEPAPVLPQLDPSEIPGALKNYRSKIVPFETGEIVGIHAPDENHPYYYPIVRLEFEGRFADLEFYRHETRKKGADWWAGEDLFIGVIYKGERHAIQADISLKETIEKDRKNLEDNYFDASRHQALTSGQPARMFLEEPDRAIDWSDGEHKIIFPIPDYASHKVSNYSGEKNREIRFQRSRNSKPPYPIKPFNTNIPAHKKVVDLLTASEWVWRAPGEIKNVTQLVDGSIEVTYFRKTSA